MSAVSIDVRQLSGDDTLVTAASGQVWFAPYLAYHVEDGADDYLVTGQKVQTRLVDGVATVDLPETPVDNLMRVQLRGIKGYGAPWYVQIPAGDCDLFDLPHIDPDTLDPIAPPSPAWVGPLATVAADATVAQDAADAAQATADAATSGLSGKADTSALSAEATTRFAADALKTNRDLPSYVASTVTGQYDQKMNAYNYKPSNTRRLRAGLAKAMAGGQCEIVTIGDSEMAGCTDGVGLTYDRPRAWPIAMRDELARHGIPVGGSGLIRVIDNTVVDARWAKTGVWTDSGKWYSFTTANAATRTLTADMAGDRVSVTYYDSNDGATFTVTVNGVSQGTVTSVAPAGIKVVTFSAAIAVGQTIVITSTLAAKIVDIVGAQVWSNANGGLIVHNIAQSGAKAAGAGASSWSDVSATTALGTLINNGKISTTGTATPAAVFIGLGGNDGPVAVTPIATITAGLTTIKSKYPTSDLILVAPTPLVTSVVTDANWEAYIAALYVLADTLDVPLVDFRARMGNYAAVVANGMSTDGQGHLIAGASASLGRQVGMLLAS